MILKSSPAYKPGFSPHTHFSRGVILSAAKDPRISPSLPPKHRCGTERFLAAAGFAFALALPAFSQQPTAASFARLVDTHYNHLQSLQTRYSERYRGMGMDRTETGTLTLRRPGRMRWAYDSPHGKLFVLDGRAAISYTPGDPQATRVPAKQLEDTRSPLRFLLGHAELAKELDHLSLTLVEGGYTLSGTPRGGTGNVRNIALSVDKNGLIHAMRLEETDGATTDFTFTDEHENVPTKDSDFTFTPPPGVTVVDGPAPV